MPSTGVGGVKYIDKLVKREGHLAERAKALFFKSVPVDSGFD